MTAQRSIQGFALSPQQRRIWQRHGIGAAPVGAAGILKLQGVPDAHRLFAQLIARHEILRTTFVAAGDNVEPLQVICETSPAAISLDWRSLSGDDLDNARDELFANELEQRLDLTEPSLRVTLARIGDEEWLAFLALPALCSDASSIRLLNAEAALGSDPPLQYADLSEWLLEEEQRTKDSAFWSRQWEGVNKSPERKVAPNFKPGSATRAFSVLDPAPEAAAVAWAVVLWRRLQERQGPVDLAIELDSRGSDLARAPGPVSEYAPLNLKVDPLDKLADVSARCAQQLTEMQLHRRAFVSRNVELRALTWGFRFCDQPTCITRGDATFSVIRDVAVTEPFELLLNIVRSAERWMLNLTYNAESFTASAADALIEAVESEYARLLANPATLVCDAPAMSDREARSILAASSGEQVALPHPELLHVPIALQIARTPAAMAVRFRDRSLDYAELDASSERIAAFLEQHGVAPEKIVAVWGERSLEFPVALLGIVKAGAAFLALDPELPPDRQAGIIRDASPILLLVPHGAVPAVAGLPCRIAAYDLHSTGRGLPRHAHSPDVQPDNLAYLMYTSGSTGKPKAALITHRAIANQMEWVQREWPLNQDDRMLLKTSCGFDPSVWEVFWPWYVGGLVEVAEPEGHRDPAYLCKVMAERKITSTYFVPSMLTSVLAEPGAAQITSLGRIPAGGEAVSTQTIRNFHDAVPGDFLHLYGPAEAAIAVYGCVIPRGFQGTFAPLGMPVCNSPVYILDEFLKLTPDGAPGEICIGGLAPGRGYLNLPARTAITYVPDPYSSEPGARIYRTGDLARRHADGAIEFLGRLDRQVKINGSRVELPDVEFHLNALPSVVQGAVIAQQEGARGKRLVAYVVSNDRSIGPPQLRRAMQDRLPAFMVPSDYVFIDQMPLNMNGKLDRARLAGASCGTSAPSAVSTMPDSARRLAGIWKDVLKIDQVAPESDFFMLGGHSLLAAQVASRIARDMKISVPLRLLLDLTTLATFAPVLEFRIAADILGWPVERIEGAIDAYAANPRAGLSLPVELTAEQHEQVCAHFRAEPEQKQPEHIARLGLSEARLSSAQRRMWFLEQLSPGTSVFNVPAAIRMLSGDLSASRLQDALTALTRRHEVLRTRFFERDGEPMQRVLDKVEIAVSCREYSDAASLAVALNAEAWMPFKLNEAPLLRAAILKSPSESILVLTLHHLVCDDWSMGVMTQEVASLYANPQALLQPLPIQYADYAEWQHRQNAGPAIARQLTYWREQLRDLPEPLRLPVHFGESRAPENTGGIRPFGLNRDQGAAMEALARSVNGTFYIVMAASLNVLLHALTEQCDIVVGSPFANRSNPETEGLIGLLLNPLAIRTRFAPEDTFTDVLRKTRDAVSAAYANQDAPYETVLSALDNAGARRPFRVWLSVQNAPAHSLRMGDVEGEVILLEPEVAHFDLALLLSQQSLQGFFEYRKDLFAGNVDSFIALWKRIIAEAVERPDLRIAEMREHWVDHTIAKNKQALSEFRAASGQGFSRARRGNGTGS